MLKEGDKLPNVELFDLDGEKVNLQNYIGQKLVVYFYPKDDTSGCTVEACSFRDANDEIQDLGAKIIGISKDGVKSHIKFTEKNNLNFDLLSDESLEANKAFDVWAEKSMYGRKYMGTERATFVFDEDGICIKVWEKVKPNGHAEEVLEFLKG